MIPSKTTPAGHAPNGFALVVTLSLMILLTIIAVGLLSLSSISLRSSSQGQAAAEARANARLALMMAIGELQKELGPDSRISAPHDAGTAATGGQPRWTAVYDAWQRSADPATPESPASRVPKFRGWLASGANQATGGPTGTADKALLVAANSLGGTATAADEVRVPMHEVSTGRQRGRLAWWTADESVKAKVNAGPDASTPVARLSNSFFDAQAPANVGHRALPKLEKFDWKDGQRAKTISTAQVNLAAGLVGPAGVGNLSHDLTVHSAGVLTDVTTGRLKRDLTQLLSRPLAELRDKPLYLANGRMNRFDITADGAVANKSFVKPWKTSQFKADEWGINLEELALFHNIHSVIDWSGGVPTLVTKENADELAQDPFYMYGRHCIEAMQFILSLQARQTGGTAAAPTYTMDLMLDGMVALANPNDVRLRFSPGLIKSVRLNSFPYEMKLKIGKANGTNLVANSKPANLQVFQGFIEGGSGGTPAAGFDLEPGEAAAFGSTKASGFDLNIRRGFVPSGGVRMTGWNLGTTGLGKDDKVDFELMKTTTATNNSNANCYYQAWHDLGTPRQRIFESANLLPDNGAVEGALMNKLLPPKILPPEVRSVSDFIAKPQPIMVLNIIKNVEQSSSAEYPDALPSRPNMLSEPAVGFFQIWRDQIPHDLHENQLLFTAEPLNYQFRSLAAGAGGRNVYQGGGRQPGLGGDFRVIKRRIPLAPPLSLGAFENAIAGGFCSRFGELGGAWNQTGPGVNPSSTALGGSFAKGTWGFPVIAKAIGNSFTNPHLAPEQVYRAGSGSLTSSRTATDPSWMVNTALWDSWFLSGIVNGSATNPASPMKDKRTARAQFQDLAEGKGLLRNKRFLFHPYKSPADALTELFTGENFKPSALNNIAKYLLIDGAFNVNSTSVNAWAALLSSVRDQELLTVGGGTQKFDHPFGTLGYAQNTATTGTQGDCSGLRSLTSDEIKKLATAMVAEVKARGPFLSLADFVNRRPNASDSSHKVVGPLQAAIDKSGLNERFAVGGRLLTGADLAPLPGSGSIDAEPVPARAVGSTGHLRQAGILTALGSQITVRSDTFVVRAYGDSRDNSGKVQPPPIARR